MDNRIALPNRSRMDRQGLWLLEQRLYFCFLIVAAIEVT
jgi:hypothetical protein